jgi:adenylyltransferase/sulfurtransferase
MKNISVQELKKMMDSGEDFQLIDIREPFEYGIAHINGELIPMYELVEHTDKIKKDKKVILMCHTGGRSAMIAEHLELNFGINNLYNLEGGIAAWTAEIDPNIPGY